MPGPEVLNLEEDDLLSRLIFESEIIPDQPSKEDKDLLNESQQSGDLEEERSKPEKQKLLKKSSRRILQKSKESVEKPFKQFKMDAKINPNKRRFFELASQFKGVCLARCSPSMKSLITEILCIKMNKHVLTIGDGGNDVGMIQISSVGIGVLGKEGNQAALAADINITEFKLEYFVIVGACVNPKTFRKAAVVLRIPRLHYFRENNQVHFQPKHFGDVGAAAVHDALLFHEHPDFHRRAHAGLLHFLHYVPDADDHET